MISIPVGQWGMGGGVRVCVFPFSINTQLDHATIKRNITYCMFHSNIFNEAGVT